MRLVLLRAAKNLGLWLVLATSAGAQRPGTIAGSVIDATTGSALRGAVVTLTAGDGLGLLGEPSPSAPSFAFGRTIPTGAAGEYRFSDLPVGEYRLYVRRIGYVPAALDVRLGDVSASSLSIGLVVAPVRLRAVEVRATEHDARIDLRPDPHERIAAARARQRAFLATDVRELTSADVAESATLAGGDVLRSLQRLPGISPFDDWSAKLLVRGNRWDHDRIYYDDLPLFDPLGALGRASGVSSDAIGAAFLHPGVRPVSLGGEGATRIDLRSRPATTANEWRASTTLTQLGLGGSAERAREDGTAGIAMTAQHSVANLFSSRRRFNGAIGDPVIADAQASLRADLRPAATSAMEVSALANDDARSWTSSTTESSVSQRWGNVAGRMTYRTLVGRFVASQTIGATHFETRANDWVAEMPSSGPLTASMLSTRSSVDYLMMGGRIAGPSTPTLGYDIVTQRSALSGPRQSLYWGDLSLDSEARARRLTYGSVWVDHRTTLGERLAIDAGGRADVGNGTVVPAGAFQARFSLSSRTLLSAGVSRSNQYVQNLELPIVAHGPTTPSLWLTTGDDVPTMSVDNASVGVERWLGEATLLVANVYARRTTGMIVGDPTPGPLSERPLFVVGNQTAHGAELSARKLSGRLTGFASYSYSAPTTRADGFAYAADATHPHSFDLAASVHAGSTRVTGAFKAASGAPFTRIVSASHPQPGQSSALFTQSAPNAARLPSFASLDLFLDHTFALRSTQLMVFAGAQNVLGRTNRTWFQASGICEGDPSPGDGRCADRDLIEAPIRFTPSVGLKLAF